MNPYKHKTPIQIRFKDVDKMGHVNNANHLTYIELARVDYFEKVVGESINYIEPGFILARVEIDYRHPILLEDNVFVYTRCARLGNKSFELEWIIARENNADKTPVTLANGVAVIVCFDYVKQSTVTIPGEWKQKMLAYESVAPVVSN